MLFDTPQIPITKPNIIWNEAWVSIMTDFFAKIQSTNQIKNQFLIISWPENIGKSTAMIDLSNQLLWNFNDRDLMHIQDLSDIWSEIKESNKLTGRIHTLKIESDNLIKINKDQNYINYGAREINAWLSISPHQNYKILLLENIERMNEESANAFLKNFEEPLPNRLIIATTSNINKILPTIKSRWFLYQRNLVNKEEIGKYTLSKYPDLSQKNLSDIWLACWWRPWLAIKLANNLQLLQEIINFDKFTKNDKYWYLKNLNDKWNVYSFLDIYIWYIWSTNPEMINKYIKFIKYNKANMWVDSILFDFVMS